MNGKSIEVDFFVKSPGVSKIPVVSAIKLNNEAVCSDDEPSFLSYDGTSCAKFEMVGNGTGGRWDGVLTLYPQFRSRSVQVDIELDSPVWALGVIDEKTFLPLTCC